MFQFMKENKMVTFIFAMMITLIVSLVTGFVAQHPALSIGFMLVGLVVAFTGFYNQVMRPRSE